MKSLTVRLIPLVAIYVATAAQSLELPVTQSATFNLIDLDGDAMPELSYQLAVAPSGISDNLFYAGYLIQPQARSRALRASSSVVPLQDSQLIDATNPVYQIPNVSSTQLPLNEFSEELVFPNWFYFDLSSDPFFTNKTSLLIGFRADLDDGRHYGWLSFSRPNTEFTTPFTLDSWNWNPVPDLPIKAGLPPEIPLSTEVVEEGGQPILRITWPAAVSSWDFQSTTNLATDVWESYPAPAAGVDIPLGEEAEPNRYFRLRQP